MRELPPTAGLRLNWSDFLGVKEPLEQGLAGYLKTSWTSSVLSSGTASLVVAFEALKSLAPKRDEVVIPGFTCPLVVIAAVCAGLRVRPCDLRVSSFEMDLECLERLLSEHTLCVVPTHLGGLPVNIAQITLAARAHGAFVIEDAAQALGATRDGRSVGLEGDLGIFSLAAGKGLTVYEGGFIVSEDEGIRSALRDAEQRMLPQTAASIDLYEAGMFAKLVGYRVCYNSLGLRIAYGVNLRRGLRAGRVDEAVSDVYPIRVEVRRIGAWRKCVAASALRRLPVFVADNAARASERAAQIDELPGVSVIKEPSDYCGSWPFLMVLFDSPSACRRALKLLWTSGLGVTKLFASEITGYGYLKDLLPQDPLPRSAAFAQSCLTISNSELVTDVDFEQILVRLKKALEDQAAEPDRRSDLRSPIKAFSLQDHA